MIGWIQARIILSPVAFELNRVGVLISSAKIRGTMQKAGVSIDSLLHPKLTIK